MKNVKLFFLLFLSFSVLFAQGFNEEKKISKINIPAAGLTDQSKMIKTTAVRGDENSNKISPLLRFHRNKATLNSKGWLTISTERIDGQPLINFKNTTDGVLVPILIKSNSVNETILLIENSAGNVQTIAGNILTAEVPFKTIDKLQGSPEVVYIDVSFNREAHLDVSHQEINAHLVHSGNQLPQAYKGEDVVVGVIDSGIDWSHPDFYNSGGVRIQYLWDQSGSSGAPAGYNYGREYTKAQLDAGQSLQVDGDDGGGHGTHVTGTAAGDANTLTGYQGIAPSSDIIFVKGFREGPFFADNDVINGCSYIFSKAAAMNKPAVINLSLGGHFGPHDGSSLYEQALSSLTGNGKIIAASAGNEGTDLIHLSYSAAGSGLSEARQSFWVIGEGESESLIDMWYDQGNISVGIVAYDQFGNQIGYTNPIAPGNVIEDEAFLVNGVTYGYFSIDATTTNDPNNGARRVVIYLDSKNQTYDLSSVTWAIYTYGTGTFDAWIATGGSFTIDSNPTGGLISGDNNKSIGTPGTAKKVICVGSYMSKQCWNDKDGNNWCYNSGQLGARSPFSSMGPTRDGRKKPDIIAPGQAIGAALSGDVTIGTGVANESVLAGSRMVINQGTSMSCPHVTGTIALMLERNPNLNYTDVLDILTNSSITDQFTGAVPNNEYGYGKLDAHAAVTSVGGGSSNNTILEERFDTQSFPPAGWTVSVFNSSNTWGSGNPQENSFNGIDPTNISSAICPWVAENQNEWLITPSFSLGEESSSIEFFAGHSTSWLTSATLKLHLTLNGGASWIQLWEARNDQLDWQWRNIKVDLSAYSGNQNVNLGWQYVGNDGDLVGIDNVKIEGSPGVTGVDSDEDKSVKYKLSQNYPNPFNPSTVINFQLAAGGHVKLVVFDILGREIATLVNEMKAAGNYEVKFGGDGLPSGVYFYRIETQNYTNSKKMILIR